MILALWLQWFCKKPFPYSTYFELKVLIAKCVTLEGHKKTSVECCSKEERSSFLELSLQLALIFWLQCFCKIPFPYLTSFKLKDLIAECATLESYDKQICSISQQGTEKSIFRVIFRIGFGIMNAMILQKNISRFHLFRIERFNSRVCYFGELQRKIYWMSQQGTEKRNFRVIFQIDFSIMTAMILQKTISIFNLFWIESFDS